MPPRIEYAEYDKIYEAEERRKQSIENYGTYKSWESLRAIALEYVDKVLRFKYQGDTSEGLREWLEQAYGIPKE
jgi:hypothetical protein